MCWLTHPLTEKKSNRRSRDFQFSMSKAVMVPVVLLTGQVIVDRPGVFTIELRNKGKQRNVDVLSWIKEFHSTERMTMNSGD